MRIQNDGITSAAASQTAPADGAAQARSSNPGGAVNGGASSGGDQVDISSLSGNLASAGGALAHQQAARVSQLAALYSKGQYQADSLQTSRALVAGAIGGGSVEGDN